MICPQCQTPFERKGRQIYCRAKCRREHFEEQFQQRTGTTYGAHVWRKRWPAEEREARAQRRKPMLRRIQLMGGVNRVGESHYRGKRHGPSWVAQITVGDERRYKRFSVKLLGEKGARLAAVFLRLSWLIEMGGWRPDDGDPLAILNYTDLFRANAEYSDSEVVDVDSPML